MKALRLLMLKCLCLAALGCAWQARAADFDLVATGSPNPVVVGNALTYTINVTNRSGILLSNVLVIDALPASAALLAATNSSGTVSNFSSSVFFPMDPLTNGGFALITVVVQPTAPGNITNVVSVMATNAITVTTNVTTAVFGAQADLAVILTGPATQVLTNDWMTYALTVTNSGPGAVSGVVASNQLPAGVGFISLTPSNHAFTVTSSNILFNVGTLAGGGFVKFQIRVQPTNSGALPFFASVSATSLLDTNALNDTAITNINVETVLAGQLTVSLVSTQRYNPQTGLMEQTVRLTNNGTNATGSARVIVTGVTNRLVNAAGTNDGNPFVIHTDSLGIGESVDLTLKFFVPTRLPTFISDAFLAAVEVSPFSVPVPDGRSVLITRNLLMLSGNVLLEFAAVPGRNYTVIYSTNSFMTNEMVVLPAIVAPADRVQWIDDGPPETRRRVVLENARFYRVLEIQ